MKDHPIDPTVPIVTLVFDCTTDHRSFHLCKKVGTVHAEDEDDAEEEEEEDDEAHEEEEKAGEEDQDDDENISADILDFAALLGTCSRKDAVPLVNLATHLAAFACRVHDAGKTLHLLLTGCNTVNLVLPLHQKLSAIRPEALGSVWMLATNDVWPGDLSTFLWCNYGSLVTHDLADYRRATRVLLDEYTAHWKRQKLQDVSMSAKVESLANLVLLDRLDRVVDVAGFAKMDAL
jgi:hypothetical protein